MSSTVVNITAQAAVGAAKPGGAAANAPLGAFEAVMGAFFAGVDGVIADGKGGSPFAGEGAPDPAQHNLDISKLPPKAHPAVIAANGLAQSETDADADAAAAAATAAETTAGGLTDVAALDAAVVAPAEDKAADEVDTADSETTDSVVDSLSMELTALAQAPAPPVQTTAAADEAAATSAGAPPPTPKHVKADETPKTIPGANASDTARLHAAANSAVARAAAQAPAATDAPPAPPVEAAAPAMELAVAQAQTHAESAPPAAPRKAIDKPARSQQSGLATEATPQDAAQPARTEATPPADAPGADKAPKLAGQAADAPAAQPAQPAQPDEAMPATPAEPSARSHAASAAAPAEAAQVRGSPETVATLSAQIVKKLGARTTHFDVQLDPVGLGKVNVRVAINADGQVSAAMRFDNPQAAAELRSRASELQRALAQSGFDLSGGMSFDVTQDQGGGFGGQQNAFTNNDSNSGHAFRGRAFAAAMETAGDAAQAALPAGAYGQARGPAKGVDVRI